MILEALQISYCLANCMLDFSLSLGPSRAVGAWDHLLNNRWLSSLANCACYQTRLRTGTEFISYLALTFTCLTHSGLHELLLFLASVKALMVTTLVSDHMISSNNRPVIVKPRLNCGFKLLLDQSYGKTIQKR